MERKCFTKTRLSVKIDMKSVLLEFLYLPVSISYRIGTKSPPSSLLLDFDISLGLAGLAVHPEGDEAEPSSNGDPNTADPGVSSRDNVTPGVLVVGEVADGDGALLLDVGEEGTAVLDEEVVDTMLVGELEGLGEDGRVGGSAGRNEVQAVEGRKHAEFQLKVIA